MPFPSEIEALILQVQTTVDYIEEHRVALEPEFAKAVQHREEWRDYYDQLAAERWQQIKQRRNLTPQQKAVYALLDEHRAQMEEDVRASHFE